jgi:hypothetical protein
MRPVARPEGGKAGRILARGVAAGVALLTAAAAAIAAESPEVGASFSGMFPLAGKQVALPEGTWTVVGRGFASVPELEGDAYGAIETVVLFRLDGSRVDAFVSASRNLVPVEEGWGTASECLGEDVELPLTLTYDSQGAHTFCGFVGEVRNVVTPASPTAWRSAAMYGKAHGLVPAATWLMAGYRLSDRSDVLDVRYHFNPVLRGAPTDDDEVGDALRDWLNRMREPVRLGFTNDLAGLPPVPMPWTEAAQLPSPVLMAKLDQLAGLRQAGVLDEAQFKAQQALILKQKPRVVAAPISNESLTLIKTFAEQITAAGPLFLGNLLVLQSPGQAVQLLGIQSVADFAHDYAVEWSWNTYGPQRLREEPTVDLPVAGVLE